METMLQTRHESSTLFHFERSRLNDLFMEALKYKLVAVCAGAGYGKTTAVHDFIEAYQSPAAWVQLSKRDNSGTRFWENYIHTLLQSNVPFAKAITKLGFPDTNNKINHYLNLVDEYLDQQRFIIVFDDFHVIENPSILRFAERAIENLRTEASVILISRSTPNINTAGLISKERLFNISENDLRFTDNELAQFFYSLNIPAQPDNLRKIMQDTEGWIFAINLIARSWQKAPGYGGYLQNAMKTNIFRLMETELWDDISERLQYFLVRLSLIGHLSVDLITLLAEEDDDLIDEMESQSAFVRRDSYINAYLIHPLFLEFLAAKHELLSENEKNETYTIAAQWCNKNGYHMDEFSYYEKLGDYSAIVRKIGTFNVQIPPDMAGYALELFDNAPDAEKFHNPIFPGIHIRVRISIGQFDEDTLALAHKYAEVYEAWHDPPDRYRALSFIYFNWAFLLMFRCTYTDVYDFDIYFKKFDECYSKNPFKTIGAYNLVPISAWASLVGTDRAEAQEEYIDAVSRSIPATSALGKGFLVGFDDLAWGELYFYRGEFNDAEKYLKQSIDKTRMCDQYVTQNCAQAYLMRLAFFRGDFISANRYLQEMEEMLNEKDHGVRYTMYDIACGFFHLILGQPEQIPEWLKDDFSSYAHPAFLENYANRIKVQYHFQKRKYSALLAFIENVMEQKTILFNRIELKAMQALSLYQLKKRKEALAALTEAYRLSESNKIIVLFTQHSKDMRTLTSAALKDNTCNIPRSWLEEINRKSAAYTKQQSHIIAEYRKANHMTDKVIFSPREKEVLIDLSHGLSRTDIAANRRLSVNTVKMVITNIYNKLGVENFADLIRTVVEQKII